MISILRFRAVALVAVAVLGFGAAAPRADAAQYDVILEWNQQLTSNLPPTAGLFTSRYYAMLHIAMFDAVNAIESDYQPYHVSVWSYPGASAEAAAAQAGHDVLVALIPAAQATFDATLQARLATLQPWRAAQGVAVGKKVAQAVVDWRTGDGAEKPNVAYVPPALPGLWQPTAPGQVATFVQFAGVEPFGVLTTTQFLPIPPPLLNSAEYSANVNEVKDIGSSGSAMRSAEQTLLARLFAGVGYGLSPWGLWNNVARDVAAGQNLSLVRAARLFALVHASMHDGLQTSHVSKYVYGLWRPVTAIQRAGEDANDATLADAAWAPLLGTPPYPAYSSNMTCIGVSAARALARGLRSDAVAFNVTWPGTGGNANVTRSYTTFSQLAEEQALSRLYGGIHFRFDLTSSQTSCTDVSDYIADNYMRPRPFGFFH